MSHDHSIENPAAFPVSDGLGGGNLGMTLRDYFAAKALPYFLAHFWAAYETDEECEECERVCARNAYVLADAMLAARGTQ